MKGELSIEKTNLFLKLDQIDKQEQQAIDGITIAVKDNFCTKNIPTTCASEMLKDFIPTYDATVYSKLINNGACLIGKSNLDEFAMGSGTVDSIFGPTRNAWGYNGDTDWRIAGGSSGGSAVAVSTGVCVAGIGSDTGGSTRNPAALCGVVGIKPTYGLVSRYGLIPLVNSMDVPGIIARNVEDATRVLNCVAGPDQLDSTTIKRDFKPIELKDIDLSNVKIGIPSEYHCDGMSEDVIDAWKFVEDLLEKEKAIIKKVSLPYTSVSIAVYSILNQCEVASNMARYDGLEFGLRTNEDYSTEELYASSRSQGFNNVVRSRIFAGNYFLLTRNYEKYFLKALKLRRLIADDFKNVFNGENCVDILLTPTTLCDAPLYGDFVSKHNRDQCAFQDYCTQPANMAGIPAVSIPIRLSKNKLPISLQLMGPNLSEELLLNVAKRIESNTNTEILSKLNISLDTLPLKCQELISKVATEQVTLSVNRLDPIAISLQQSRQIAKNLEDEYEILKLKLKNKELQVKIDRNQRFMDDLRKELDSSIESLSKQSPNPDNIEECIKQMRQKVASYEESYKKATMKFSKLSVPDSLLPKSLQAQLATLASLREEESMWKQRADDVLFTRQARDAFRRRK
ncbi:Glutamyl-tRNA(Gln) amidotransferase subunit A-like [Papilio xuthus]|uniref:Glutamyl-tRNA(Gln) amidotransferase subunit A, mitochondrial n=1 Tax=Papilio xuthus TaxID=66420 RepID=A0A194PLQ4_PAPXU|nr:Glutamyl-tRNA(Gln) amidotransferase subunit A-like [Papilio xuthus]